MGLLLAAFWGPSNVGAQAQVQPTSQAAASQTAEPTYEDARVDRVLSGLGARRARAPEGRPIAYVRTVRQDVFVEGELLFDWIVWFNKFHWLTRDETVERELRMASGQPYQATRARETERNLRALGIFSLVRVVPVEADEGQVGVIVYTRDLWSLRLETDFEATNNNLQVLAQLVQRNLFGLNQTATARFERRWDSFSVGERFYDYRALDGEVLLSESGDLIFNGETRELEGGVANVRVSRPFYNLDQRWSWEVSGGFLQQIRRDVRAGRVALTGVSESDTPCSLWVPQCLRGVYRSRSGYGRAYGLYRIGSAYAYRQTFAAGGFFSDQHVEPVAETRLPEGLEDEFARLVLPKVRRQVGPFVRYQAFLPHYERFTDLASFGRIETVQVGPSLYAEMSWPLAFLGSSANALRVVGSADYVIAGNDALAAVRAYGTARLEGGRVVDQVGSVRLRFATPSWWVGRLVWQWSLTGRLNDTSNAFVALNGLTGLRGFSGAEPELQGRGVGAALSNLEFRSKPVEIESVHLGLVAFYDAGGLFRHVSQLDYVHSVGLGLRVLIPQLNRMPFRFDFGVPVQGGEGGFSVNVAFGGAQAVRLTPEEDVAASQDIRSLSN